MIPLLFWLLKANGSAVVGFPRLREGRTRHLGLFGLHLAHYLSQQYHLIRFVRLYSDVGSV